MNDFLRAMLNDYVSRTVRTIVPIVVGFVIAKLTDFGIDVSEAELFGALSIAYHQLATAVEKRFPQAWALLGAPKRVDEWSGGVIYAQAMEIERLKQVA